MANIGFKPEEEFKDPSKREFLLRPEQSLILHSLLLESEMKSLGMLPNSPLKSRKS
jgi:hypothetical protein